MLRWIIGAGLQFRHLIVLIAAVLIVYGAVQLRSKPFDLLPEFTPPVVQVQTEALGLSSAEVEELITSPLEEILAGVPWLKTVESTSIANLSSIVLTFEAGTDLMNARQMVQERLLHASALPRVSRPPTMLQPVSTVNRVMQVGLSSDSVSLIDISVLARWKIKPRLMGVPGVAAVSIWGQRERQLQVQVDPEKLRDKGILLDNVIQATGDALWVSPLSFLRASTPGNGGFIDTPSQRMDIRHVLPIRTPEDLSQVTFLAGDGSPMHLGDIASVVEGHPPMIGDAIIKDRPGLMLVVEKFPWANTREVTQGVENALQALQPGLPGVNVDSTVFRPASFIESSATNLRAALIVGGALLAVVLVACLGRFAVISLVAIPLSILTAVVVLNLLGAPINILVLAGFAVALGAVIDDAVVGIQNIVRRLREHRDAGSPGSISDVILEASVEVRQPLLYATVVLAIAVLPLFFLGGTSASFFRPFALAYFLALLASLGAAMIVTPALTMLLMSRVPQGNAQPPLADWLHAHYDRLLTRVFESQRQAVMAVGAVVVLCLAVLPFVGGSLLPEFKERDLMMQWQAEQGTSYPEMARMVSAATQELRAIDGIQNVSAQLGRAIQSDTVAGVNTARVWLGIAPGADYEATLAAAREVVGRYPGLHGDPVSYATMRMREVLTGSARPVVVRVFGPNLAVLQEQAEAIRSALAGVGGIVNPEVQTRAEEPGIEIEVDLAAAEQHGLKPGDVRRAASTLMAGIEVGNLFEEQKIFEVVVWSLPETRRDIDSIRQIVIDTPSGGRVRLGDIADVRTRPSVTAVTRSNASRYVDVTADVSGRELDAVVGDVRTRLGAMEFPREYHPEIVGEYAERQAAQSRVLWASIAVAAGVLFLLQASFGSWLLAGLIYLLLPAAAAGSLLAAAGVGGVVSLGALAGLLAVLGIALRSGVLLINRYQDLEDREGQPFGPALLMQGARERLLPILTTAVATAVAVLPMVLFGNVPGIEIFHPMAVVMIAGLVTSTAVTLFAVPVVYGAIRSWAGRRMREPSLFEDERRVQYAAE